MSRCLRFAALLSIILATMALPGPTDGRSLAVDITNCSGSGYLQVTGDRGTASPFTSARECQQFVKAGGTLYAVPVASWSEVWEYQTTWEGELLTWCDAVFTAWHLDPAKTYYAHTVEFSLWNPGYVWDFTQPVPVTARGKGTIIVPFEECTAAPISAYGELLDANGAILATSGPVKLFTLS